MNTFNPHRHYCNLILQYIYSLNSLKTRIVVKRIRRAFEIKNSNRSAINFLFRNLNRFIDKGLMEKVGKGEYILTDQFQKIIRELKQTELKNYLIEEQEFNFLKIK